MPLSRSRDYLSIGEVLEAIRGEFPDVSISKIRFLENEGLIAPERTTSGYRKFYATDVARLRHILSLQRDHFLPLRVIKERISAGELDGAPEPLATTTAEDRGGATPAQPAPELLEDVALSRAELARAAGLSEPQLAGLEDYSILAAPSGGVYDGNDLVACTAAAGLLGFGLEPRHLRMLRQSVARELDLAKQIVAPAAQRRDASAQVEAAEALDRILDLMRRLREALLRSSVGQTR